MKDTTNERVLSLREFWMELQRSKAERPCLSSARSGSGSSRLSSSSSGRSSGSAGSGSGLLGYGLGLIASDLQSQERIMRIMRDICERDARRGE